MIIDTMDVGRHTKTWEDRITRIYRLCRRLLAEIGNEEWEWAPESGVPSIKDHAVSILKNADAFVIHLSSGSEVKSVRGAGASARAVADRLGEIEIAARRLLAAIPNSGCQQAPMSSATTTDLEEIEELCFAHIAGLLQSTAHLQSLRRLIDPSRVPLVF